MKHLIIEKMLVGAVLLCSAATLNASPKGKKATTAESWAKSIVAQMTMEEKQIFCAVRVLLQMRHWVPLVQQKKLRDWVYVLLELLMDLPAYVCCRYARMTRKLISLRHFLLVHHLPVRGIPI